MHCWFIRTDFGNFLNTPHISLNGTQQILASCFLKREWRNTCKDIALPSHAAMGNPNCCTDICHNYLDGLYTEKPDDLLCVEISAVGLNQMVLAGAVTCLTGGVLCRRCSIFTPPGRGRGGSSANVNTTAGCAPLQQPDCIPDGADCSGAVGSTCPSPCAGTLSRYRAWEHTSLSDWSQPLPSAQWQQSLAQWVLTTSQQFMWQATRGSGEN